jgi:hypothetical protein
MAYTPGWGRLFLVAVLLTLPVLLLYGAQLLNAPDGTTFSGFIQFDMPLYVADAHQYVEGHGSLFYANPYDWNPDSPAIYFQPLIWLLGQLQRLGVGPVAGFLGLGLASCLGGMVVLQLLLRDYARLPRGLDSWILVLAAWGGGLLMLGYLVTGRPLDPGDGFWNLNLGRNFIYPTEAFYHLLTLLIFWLVIRGRIWLTAGVALFLAISHPFTGAQYAAILLGWGTLEWLSRSGRIRFPHLPALALPLLLVVGYYMVYLPGYPTHAALVDQYSVNWSPGLATQLAAYGPVAGFAAHRLWADRAGLGAAERFMIVAAVVSLLLANHGLFITPRQPLHFTRGHVWFPLFLLGLPSLVSLARYLRDRFPRKGYARWMVLITFLALFDNLSFFAYRMRTPTGIFLSESNRELVGVFENSGDAPVVLTRDLMSAYLLPVYTSARSFVSHKHNTPDYTGKLEELARFLERGRVPDELAGECVVVAVRRGEEAPSLPPDTWRRSDEGSWTLLRRAGHGCP